MNTPQKTAEYQVVIVGMGPIGLSLANLLGQAGVRTLMLERDLTPYGLPRAVAVDDESMRVYQAMGLDEEIAPNLVMDLVANFVLPDGRLLANISPKDRSYWRSPMAFHYQPTLEEVLRKGTARFANVETRMGCLVCDVKQDAGGVTVGFRTAVAGCDPKAPVFSETVDTVRADYVLACDGGRSPVRELHGIKMLGRKYPDQWLVIDIKCPSTPRHLPYFNYYCDPKRPHLNCPQPNGHHRFEFMLLPGETKEQMESPETVRRLISKFVNPDEVEIIRALVYSFNGLVAERWREGRVLLCGDAAHMNPQFFGQGMNSGMRDASNLAWKLIQVLKGHANPKLLDSYQRERLAHYQKMLKISVQLGYIVSLRNPLAVWTRNTLASIARATPWLGKYIDDMGFKPRPELPAGLRIGIPRGLFGAEGKMMIQPNVRTLDGKHVRLDDLLGSGFALIGNGIDPRTTLNPSERKLWDELGTRYLCAWPAGQRPGGNGIPKSEDGELIEVECMTGTLDKWFSDHAGLLASGRGQVAVIRPDRFVLAQKPAQEMPEVTRYVQAQFQGA